MQSVQTYRHDMDAPMAIRMEPRAFAQSVTRQFLGQVISHSSSEFRAHAPNQDHAPANRHAN